MKIMSLILSLCLTANVFASTGVGAVQELERSLDAYQYSMTVEWNQKDQAFYTEKTEAFFNELGALMKNGGITQAELLSMLDKKVADKNAVAAIKAKLTNVSSATTSAELAKILKDNADQFYARGASWNGEIVTIGLGVLIAGVLAYAVWFSITHKCVAFEQAYVCNNYATNYGNFYAGGYYGGYIGGYYTYCGYQDVCTDYEKK